MQCCRHQNHNNLILSIFLWYIDEVGTPDDNPLVTIVIPTYNYAKYLGKTLGSCMRQSYERLEVIVIDDGSTDDTEDVYGVLRTAGSPAAGRKTRVYPLPATEV